MNLCMLGGVVRKVHLFKSDLEIERVIRPAFCHSGAGTVGGNEKEKQKAEMKKKGYTFLGAQVFIATSNFSRVPTVICTQVNKNAIIYSCALCQYEKRTAIHSTVLI